MAVGTAVPTVTRKFKVGRVIKVYGTIALTAATDTYATNGIVLDWSGKVPGCRKPPVYVDIQGSAGYKFEWSLGTTIANGKMLIRIATTTSGNNPLSQHSAAAFDALVVADTIRFVAEFDALQ